MSRYERACEIVGCSGGEWEFCGAALEWLTNRLFLVKFTTYRNEVSVCYQSDCHAAPTLTAALTEAVLAVAEPTE